MAGPASIERAGVGVDEVAQAWGVHPLTVRRAIARGDLTSIRIGRRVLVPLSALKPTRQQPQEDQQDEDQGTEATTIDA